MSKGGAVRGEDKICIPCCTPSELAEDIISALLCENEDQALALMSSKCSNYNEVADYAGRTVLHIAASCGNIRVLKCLLRKGVNINIQDKESGYTPLHRCVYHGKITCARLLMMNGADLTILDNEGLTALDLIMKDTPSLVNSYNQECNPDVSPYYEAYTWGTNLNGNLGIGSILYQHDPEKIHFFTEKRISILKVSIGECHSIFISEEGEAYSCGLGGGGRLGHGNEENVTSPRKINLLVDDDKSFASKSVVLYASVGVDHSVLVTKSGTIFTFGKNDCYQLGLNPPPYYQLNPKAVPLTINDPKGVSAARYHTVVWSTTDLYTWGYNSGQLGYRSQDNYQKTPKRMGSVKGIYFLDVASTDKAIVIATLKGDLYLMHEYTCVKIGDSLGVIKKLHISVGVFDPAIVRTTHRRKSKNKRRKDNINVVTLNEEQKLMLWQSSNAQFSRCGLQVGSRSLSITDACISHNKLIVVTNEHQVFESDSIIYKSQERNIPENLTPLQKLMENNPTVIFQMKKVRGAHRAMSVYCNSSGSNHCMLQVNPVCFISMPKLENSAGFEKCLPSLLEDATESDYICDVVFSVAGVQIPAHRYIIESNCMKLASVVNSTEETHKLSFSQCRATNSIKENDLKNEKVLRVKLDNIHPLIFKGILKYIYTKKFDYCTPHNWSREKDAEYACFLQSNEALMQFYSMIYKHKGANVDFTNKGQESEDGNSKPWLEYNPVIDARIAAAYFELSDLVKLLDNMIYNKSTCVVSWKSHHVVSLVKDFNIHFDHKSSQHLYDVSIECGFEDKVINAHKCILVMRSRYFDSVLREKDKEVDQGRKVFLPYPYEVMDKIIFYLYNNKVPFSIYSESTEFMCDLFIASDQIYLEPFRCICELTIAHHITLKNVSELFRFSEMNKAYYLRGCCLEFMASNLAALLEYRYLDGVHEGIIAELQSCYIEMRPLILCRTLNNKTEKSDVEQLQTDLENTAKPLKENNLNINEENCSKRKGGSKKRKSRNRHKLRKVIVDECTEAMSKLTISDPNPNSFALDMKLEALDFVQSNIKEGGPHKKPHNISKTDNMLCVGKDSSSVGSKISVQIDGEVPSTSKSGEMNEISFTSSNRISKERRPIDLDSKVEPSKIDEDYEIDEEILSYTNPTKECVTEMNLKGIGPLKKN